MQQKRKQSNKTDLCPMCKESLYLNEEFSQRVGIIDNHDEFSGWMCPYCKATFDVDNNLTGIHGMDEMGEA